MYIKPHRYSTSTLFSHSLSPNSHFTSTPTSTKFPLHLHPHIHQIPTSSLPPHPHQILTSPLQSHQFPLFHPHTLTKFSLHLFNLTNFHFSTPTPSPNSHFTSSISPIPTFPPPHPHQILTSPLQSHQFPLLHPLTLTKFSLHPHSHTLTNAQ